MCMWWIDSFILFYIIFIYIFFFFFFFQAEDGIRDVRTWLEFRRVLFRSSWFIATGASSVSTCGNKSTDKLFTGKYSVTGQRIWRHGVTLRWSITFSKSCDLFFVCTLVRSISFKTISHLHPASSFSSRWNRFLTDDLFTHEIKTTHTACSHVWGLVSS